MPKANIAWFSKARVETFSDGVFAIIVTLLVLELKVPTLVNVNSAAELGAALWGDFPKFLSWIVSFFMVCVIWVNHHRIFERIKTITHRVFWYNAYLLLWTSFIPFPTALVGSYPGNKLALSFFGIVLGLMGSGFELIRYTIINDELLIAEMDQVSYKKNGLRTAFFSTLIYFVGAGVAWLVPFLSFLLYLFPPVYFSFIYLIPAEIKAREASNP